MLKSVVAQYNAEQLLTQRDAVSKAVRDSLTKRAKEFNILVDDIAITHLSFGAAGVGSAAASGQEGERIPNRCPTSKPTTTTPLATRQAPSLQRPSSRSRSPSRKRSAPDLSS